MRKGIDRAAEMIRQAETILLTCHINPDGDTIGSCLALRLALLKMGKKADACCADPVPENLRGLSGADQIRYPGEAAERYDLVVAIDTASADRMGACRELLARGAHTLQLDHHGTNPGYAELNVVDGGASAAGLIVWELIHALEIPLDQEIAACIYTAVSTDTGNFTFGNTTPEAFEAAADMLRYPFPLGELSRRLFRERPLCQTRLLTRALNSLTMLSGNRIAVMLLTMRDFAESGALPEHADTLVNFGMDIEGVRMAVLLRETLDGSIKVSLRSVRPYTVAGIAGALGGGGHDQAAGCTLRDQSLQEAAAAVAKALCEALQVQEAALKK